MATLNELLDNWKQKYGKYIVRFEQLRDSAKTAGRVKKNYAVWYQWKEGTAVMFRQFGIWVFNERTADEQAFWDGAEPNLAPPPTPQPTFRSEVEQELQKLIDNGDIDSAIINTVDENLKTAEVTVYIMEVEGVSKHLWRFKKEEDGTISHEEVVQ